ncbi:hypothetical protein GCM10025854_20490 [Tetragenococcus muriaticus]|nr:hypothetical protein GCM10025854_20490 [Tetragenococcus muriaticus]
MDKKEKRSFSWFWKWFLDNKFVAGLLIIFLILVNINLFTKVSYLFFPVWQFLAIVALPIILAGILFYLLNPIVNFFEKRGIQRIYSIIGLFILVSGLIVWGVVVIIPEIREQVTMFVDRLPGYINTAENALNDFFLIQFLIGHRIKLLFLVKELCLLLQRWCKIFREPPYKVLATFLVLLLLYL